MSALSMSNDTYEIVIEVPRWGFIKRGSAPHIDFISPLPCLYNYGAIPSYIGLDGDLLDAIVLGRRFPRGSRISRQVYGVIGITDRGMYDDKFICSDKPLSSLDRLCVLNFFRCYALFKRLINFIRHRPGPTKCEGWGDVADAFAKARPRYDEWAGSEIEF